MSNHTLLNICLTGLLASAAGAQAPVENPPVSPDVKPDRSVTFRIQAPKAAEVSLYGDWMRVGTSQKMTRDAAGVWSVTVGPLPPSIYLYTFTVDGLTIADPVNPSVKLRSRTSASMVEVPANPPAVWQVCDVPHGNVEIHWQKSGALGDTRWVWVYTPPGYAKDLKRRYPVLYLLHGSNDTAAGWTLAGRANFILDNLLAEAKAVPMIVAMPYGHAVPFGSPREVQATNNARFEEYLLKDVIPLVESSYRVAPERANRAVAGLSMGGGQSLSIGLGHLELFSSVAAFSAAVPADAEKRFESVLANPKQTNERLKLLWIGCGRDDSLFERSQKLASLLRAHEVRHTFRDSEGAHTYTVWRAYLAELAPLLFRWGK
jgi:enterochelin esterase family protein